VIKLRACFLPGSLSAVPQGKLVRLLRVGGRDIDWILIALTVTRIDRVSRWQAAISHRLIHAEC